MTQSQEIRSDIFQGTGAVARAQSARQLTLNWLSSFLNMVQATISQIEQYAGIGSFAGIGIIERYGNAQIAMGRDDAAAQLINGLGTIVSSASSLISYLGAGKSSALVRPFEEKLKKLQLEIDNIKAQPAVTPSLVAGLPPAGGAQPLPPSREFQAAFVQKMKEILAEPNGIHKLTEGDRYNQDSITISWTDPTAGAKQQTISVRDAVAYAKSLDGPNSGLYTAIMKNMSDSHGAMRTDVHSKNTEAQQKMQNFNTIAQTLHSVLQGTVQGGVYAPNADKGVQEALATFASTEKQRIEQVLSKLAQLMQSIASLITDYLQGSTSIASHSYGINQ